MPKILVVDDSNANRILLKEVLHIAHPDYVISLAESGVQALEMVAQEVPDIILLDVMMPGMDGFEVCSLLKKDARFANIPVIMVTALEATDHKIKGFKVGAADYIVKPINEEETTARVEAHLKIKGYQDELTEKNEQLRRTQQALVQSEKMSAIGTLAAGVSHEFNNILTMMSGHARLSLESSDIADCKETLGIIKELIDRGKDVIGGLLDFARNDESQPKKTVDMKTVIEKDLLLASKLCRDNNVTVTVEGEQLPPIACYPSQLSQVFINIIKNAIEAMLKSPQKKITITLSRQVRQGVVPEAYELVVRISDTGPGIPANMQLRIFDPFVTTKGVLSGGDTNTPGTGLGLSVVFGIIKRHNGTITVESKEGEGATFIITLPYDS